MTSIYTYATQVRCPLRRHLPRSSLQRQAGTLIPGPDDGVGLFHAPNLSRRLPCIVASKCHIGTQEPHAAGQIRNRSDHEHCGICRILIILTQFFVCQGDMEMVGINLLLPPPQERKATFFCFHRTFWTRVNTQTDYSVLLLTGHGSGCMWLAWTCRQDGFDDDSSNDGGIWRPYGHGDYRYQCHPRGDIDHHLCRAVLGAKAHGGRMGT